MVRMGRIKRAFTWNAASPVMDSPRMRRVIFAASFVTLLAALALLWTYRYEHQPGSPVWLLADLRQDMHELSGLAWSGTQESPTLHLKRAVGSPPLALRLAIPDAPAVEALHLRFRLKAHGLTQGAEKWETGRLMIEWHQTDGQGSFEKDPVASIKNNEAGGLMTIVAVPAKGPAVPAIRLEHLGLSGDFEMSELEIIAVQERELWKLGRWLLALAWLAWLTACIMSWPGVRIWQAFAAAVICLVMLIQFVIPGPWKIQHPLMEQDFRLGEKIMDVPPNAQAPPLVEAPLKPPLFSGMIAPSGNVLVQGGLALKLRILLKPLRPLMHVVLLAVPTFAFALLVGRRRAVLLAVPLALAVECAQAAFGYGFDWGDTADLFFDGLGIWLALWLHRRLFSRLDLLPATVRSWIDR